MAPKKTVCITIEKTLVVIGEKINPTRRNKMVEALQTGNFDYVSELAGSQVYTTAWMSIKQEIESVSPAT